jgi:integrase
VAIRVKNRKLFLDFTWQHVRCKEYTGLADTPENRRRCERKMEAIDREIARGVFDYRRHFPDGSRLHVFHPDAQPTGGMTFQAYILRWHKMRSPFRADGTLARDAALHPSTWLHDEHTIRKHFLPAFGPLPLDQIGVTRINEFRRSLVDMGLAGKTVTTIMGLLHKAFADALEENLIDENPVRRIASRRQIRLHQRRTTSDPLTPAEVARFLAAVPDWYRDLYNVWSRLGWRPSEIVALRLGWLDFDRRIIMLERGRIARWGGIEAAPKTGPREVDCSYDPEIFRALSRLRERAITHGAETFIFTDPDGNPLSQEWLHKRIWKPTLERAGLHVRGQYNIRDTFITVALLLSDNYICPSTTNRPPHS